MWAYFSLKAIRPASKCSIPGANDCGTSKASAQILRHRGGAELACSMSPMIDSDFNESADGIGPTLNELFGFIENGVEVALGYSMNTDGCLFNVKKNLIQVNKIKQEIPLVYKTLLTNLFKFEVFKENKKPGGLNGFVVDAFLKVYLIFTHEHNFSSDNLDKYIEKSCNDQVIQKNFENVNDADHIFLFFSNKI